MAQALVTEFRMAQPLADRADAGEHQVTTLRAQFALVGGAIQVPVEMRDRTDNEVDRETHFSQGDSQNGQTRGRDEHQTPSETRETGTRGGPAAGPDPSIGEGASWDQ